MPRARPRGTNAYIFQGDTEADARAFYDYCVFQNGDWEGVENLVNIMGLNSLSIPVPALQNLKQHFIAGWAGYGIIGTREQVVDQLALLERAGFDGIVLTWPRYIEDMQRFKTETYPLLQQAGLR
jgi:dimethylsulfone monooxygenase